MRVLLISHTCQSRTEGQPKAHCLAAMPDIELRVLTPGRWKHYGQWRRPDPAPDALFHLETGYAALPWAGPAQSYLHFYPGLRRVLQDFQPSIIDLWEEPWSLVSAQACWLRARVLPQAKVISETEQNIDKTLPPPFEQFRHYTLSCADYCVCRNAESLEILRRKGYRGPAEVVPNAVDPALFHPLDRSACRQKLNSAGFVVGYVGRLVEEKGLLDMVEALAQCPDEVSMLFVGSGPAAAALQQRANDLQLSARVRIMPAIPLEELPDVMNALDVLALVSRTTPRWKEQFGRVIIEAQACGTPVIGSDSGAIPEVVGGGGLIVPEGNPAALAQAIERLLNNPEERARFAQEGQRQVADHYTWQRVAERMAAIYRRLVAD